MDSIGIRVVKVNAEIAYKEVVVFREYQVNLDCLEESEMLASAVSSKYVINKAYIRI
jgi:hypothetical protein